MTDGSRDASSSGDASGGYADLLRRQFPELAPEVDDLFLLEFGHQLPYAFAAHRAVLRVPKVV